MLGFPGCWKKKTIVLRARQSVPRWSTAHEENQKAVVGDEINNRTELEGSEA